MVGSVGPDKRHFVSTATFIPGLAPSEQTGNRQMMGSAVAEQNGLSGKEGTKSKSEEGKIQQEKRTELALLILVKNPAMMATLADV